MLSHAEAAGRTTMTYSDGLKQTSQFGAAITTFVWDGTDYLGAQS